MKYISELVVVLQRPKIIFTPKIEEKNSWAKILNDRGCYNAIVSPLICGHIILLNLNLMP